MRACVRACVHACVQMDADGHLALPPASAGQRGRACGQSDVPEASVERFGGSRHVLNILDVGADGRVACVCVCLCVFVCV